MSGPETLAGRLAEVVVTLRSELRFTRTLFRGEPSYIVRDPISFQTHRLTPEDYEVLVHLKDNRPLGEIFAGMREEGLVREHDEEPFYEFVLGLHRRELLNLPLSDDSALFNRFEMKRAAARRQQVMGFLFMKVPFMDPDVFLEKTMLYARPLFTRLAFVIWSLLMLVTLALALNRRDDLASPLLTLLDTGNLPWLALILTTLKVFHELGHAYACKHFGGQVPELGAMFIVGAPCAYVDATSAWSFPSKRNRLIVSLAGMYVESFFAAVALIVWAMTEASFVNSLAYQTFMMASVVTVGFNINPLMRFDGYYVMSDLVEVPNLRQRCTDEVHAVLARVFLGIRGRLARTSTGLRVFLLGFGLSSAVYKLFLVTGICALIATKVYFLGLALAGFYIFTTFSGSVLKTVRFLWFAPETAPLRLRAILVSAVLFVGLPAGFVFVPVGFSVQATGVVSASDEVVVRAPSEGFLSEVLVQPGVVVYRDQSLVELANEDLLEQRRRSTAELELLDLEIRQKRILDRVAGEQAQRRRAHFAASLRQIDERVRGMDVRAEVSGHVIHSEVLETPGIFLEEGSPICTLGAGPWKVRLLLSEAQLTDCRPAVGDQVGCRFKALPRVELVGRVETVSPVGTRDIEDEVLTSVAGGDIVVDPQAGRADTPYFEVTLTLEDDLPIPVRSGMTLAVRFDAGARRLAQQVYRRVLNFLNELRLE